ncbi:Periplasmic oligopeptide-binding protein precursor [Providencia rettgeri]|uniref:Periplasmic oligopeptide-binding protein n=1 Tax=Providencia rettgeri TaxID=587 RepID=A0A379FRL7_PRORE|nr:Periplasmic oligopeptide-binding protein precursor [Providencia rettgeri]
MYTDVDGKSVPGVAKSWSNENFTTWIFTLRDDAKNTSFYNNPDFDSLLEKALIAPDPSSRHTIYQQAEALLDKDSAIVPVYYRVSARMIKPSVSGFKGNDPLDYTDIKRLYISEPN